MPRVSIGLPVFNGENFVGQAIASALAQTYTDFELIISDNASTDATEAICQSYAAVDNRIRYERAEANRGAAWNFNRVFELARGDYFRWLSHDDLLAPTALEVCCEALEADPGVVLCANATGAIDASSYRLFDEGADTDCLFQGLAPEQEAKRIELTQDPSAARRYEGVLFHSRRCYEVYGLIRRELMSRTQLHPNYCGGEKVFLAELALWGRFRELPEPLFFCRWHDARFTANDSAREQNEHMAPGQPRLLTLPHQYRATLGYLQLIVKVRLTLRQRLSCLGTWLRFVLQPTKWATILSNTFTGKATAATIDLPTRRGERISTGLQAPDRPVDASIGH